MTHQPVRTPSPWAGDAAACLLAAMRRDRDAMVVAARTLVDHHGMSVVPQVMLAWIDTVIAQAGITGGDPARLLFADVDTGHVSLDAHDVRPEVAWAGRLLNARIAEDQDSYRALMGSVPAGMDQLYITTLLECCALSINLVRKTAR